MDERIRLAISKLDHGGWSLTIAFAWKAINPRKHVPVRIPAGEKARLRELMHATGLPHRRVPYGSDMLDVWDYQQP